MKKWLENFKKKTLFARILTLVNLGCSAAVVLLSLLYLFDVYDKGIVMAMPLMGVTMMTQCGLFWKKDRAVAIFSLLAGLFMFGVTGFIMLR